ncbi:hypothetical protein B0T14DRAFT_517604 [Immersiella caudata]|uniref:LysM domain-containing protein n=1 Tax=Immersiella caudata TaxID=314043 RepID=A0AA39WZ22_9PEZI|nr:hypothetical protein B0T14DRAFT_517604 [Immersiella caudata]
MPTRAWRAAALVLLAPWLPLVDAQQFEMYRTPFETMNLSQGCLDVLNTNVSCDHMLAISTTFDPPSSPVLRPDILNRICAAKCRSDLQALRSKIVGGCKSTDVMVLRGKGYPATFVLDHYLYTYDVSCYKHRNSGQMCDIFLGELRNQSKQPDICSDCMLGVFEVQLSSPIGYNDNLASEFSSATSKCSATGYAYTRSTYSTVVEIITSSTSYLQPTPTTGLPENFPCVRNYTVSANDTCNSIALSNNASTFDIIQTNGMTVWCSDRDLKKSGSRNICLPEVCTPLEVTAADTCATIADKSGVREEDIIDWNPIFDARCWNINKWVGWVICVGGSNRTTSPTSPTGSFGSMSTAYPSATLDPLPAQKPHAPGSVLACSRWKDSEEEQNELGFSNEGLNICWVVASLAEIELADLVAWNPSLSSDRGKCELQREYSYCIAAPKASTTSKWYAPR